MTRRRQYALVAAIAVTFAIVSTMDYHDAVRERAHYCEMVADGYWPDYKNLQGECKNG